MLHRWYSFLVRHNSKAGIIFLLVMMLLITLFFYGVHHDVYTAKMIPDIVLFYQADQFYEMLEKLQKAGGATRYIFTAWTLDLIYPAVYSLFLGLSLVRVWTKPPAWFAWLVFAPALSAVFDYCENSLVTLGILKLSTEPAWLAYAASFSSALKWGLLFVCVAAIAWAALRRLFLMR